MMSCNNKPVVHGVEADESIAQYLFLACYKLLLGRRFTIYYQSTNLPRADTNSYSEIVQVLKSCLDQGTEKTAVCMLRAVVDRSLIRSLQYSSPFC